MTQKGLLDPPGTARLVVTMPPAPSKLTAALEKDIASEYVTLTSTTDAFKHLATIAIDRLTIMIPYVDRVGAEWAAELFEISEAIQKILIIRDASQIDRCGGVGQRLNLVANKVMEYGSDDLTSETFHAKVVLADGVAAYVGSANLLYRSKTTNFECGFLVEGPAVQSVKLLLDAVTSIDDT